MYPEAGVTVANPATIPVTIPIKDGLPNLFHSINIQTNAAVAAEICVTNIAIPAFPLAPNADPALNPNQPTQSIAAPIIVRTGLCGGVIDFGNPFLLPIVKAATSAAVPAVAWTTIPPAKSITPHEDSNPPPQTQCVTGT